MRFDLHYEVISEAGTFKGTMTSAGCALLLAAMLTLFLGELAHTMLGKEGFPNAARVVKYCWIVAVVVILLLFLGLQFLLPLAQKAENKSAGSADGRDDSPSDEMPP